MWSNRVHLNNVTYDICIVYAHLSSGTRDINFDLSLNLLPYFVLAVMALMRPHGCAGSSAPILLAERINTKVLCAGFVLMS